MPEYEPIGLAQGRVIGQGLGSRYREIEEAIRSAASRAGQAVRSVADTGQSAYSRGSIASPFGSLPIAPFAEAREGFMEGYDPNEAGPMGEDGVPEYLRRPDSLMPEPLPIEQHIQAAMPPPPATVEQSVAASEPQGRVQVSFGGKTYDYSNGRNGGAPLAGGQLGGLFGREWSNQPSDQTHEFAGEGNGSFSQMNELPDSMKSIQQLTDERAIGDASPAAGLPPAYQGLGITRGDMRGVAIGGLQRAQDPKVQQLQQTEAMRAENAQALGQLEQYLRSLGRYTDDQIRTSLEAAARDLFLKQGFREGELGALGSYLKPSAIGLQ